MEREGEHQGAGRGSFKIKYTDRFLDFYKVLGFAIKSNFKVKHITLGVSISDFRKLGQLQTQKFHMKISFGTNNIIMQQIILCPLIVKKQE